MSENSLKCVLAFKWARNPEDARVGLDGAVDWSSAKMAASDDDEAAALLARGLSADITGLTLGDGDVAWAAARGASSTLSISDARPALDSGWIAAVLAAGVARLGAPAVVLVGDCTWEPAVPVLLGARLGWPVLAGVLEATAAEGSLRVTRRTATKKETLTVTTPVVLAVLARRQEKPPSMKEILAARKKPVERLTTADLGLKPPGAEIKLRGSAPPPAMQVTVYAGRDDPAGAARQLVAALRSEGVI
ncbi:MAG: electron transfer flavoprotein subunit alpha [Gracilibacteraceae bacterium]|jgi:electron transfer flavoprotein beta subunit|nr:electron transfer flavoprotein subunit alpha [Gracilibacteraceae bacterium]